MIEIPEFVRQKAVARGDMGRDWLDGLAGTLAGLEREWGLEVGATLPGGSESYVAAVRTRSGSDAVLKIEMPSNVERSNEFRILIAAQGRAYARLLDYDEDRRIMLQERLGPSLRVLNQPVATQLQIICSALREAWEIAPPEELPTGAQKARWLAEFIAATWAELRQPCSEPVIARALDLAETRLAAFDPATSVLVHGDAHAANSLQDPAVPEQVKFVDPDGLLADRGYDLGILMREFNEELLAGDALELGRSRCAYLSRLTGVDPVPIWEWGFIERVSTGLYALQVGAEQLGRDMLDVAERWL